VATDAAANDRAESEANLAAHVATDATTEPTAIAGPNPEADDDPV
jgi:hypothetical protein